MACVCLFCNFFLWSYAYDCIAWVSVWWGRLVYLFLASCHYPERYVLTLFRVHIRLFQCHYDCTWPDNGACKKKKGNSQAFFVSHSLWNMLRVIEPGLRSHNFSSLGGGDPSFCGMRLQWVVTEHLLLLCWLFVAFSETILDGMHDFRRGVCLLFGHSHVLMKNFELTRSVFCQISLPWEPMRLMNPAGWGYCFCPLLLFPSLFSLLLLQELHLLD